MPRRALILGLCLLAVTTYAQTHKVAAPEKVTRALAVYEYTGDLEKPDAARLIPVSLFINGQFQDAGVYLANPVPLALDTGIVYSIERAGDPIGTLDLDYARNIVTRRSSADDNPIGVWYGYGRFLTPAAEAKLKPRSAAKLPVIVASTDSDNPDDDKPKFVRRTPSDTTPTKPGDPSSPTASSPTKAGSATPEPDADDPDRPTLRHRDPATDDAKKKKGSNKPVGYVSGPSTSLNDDPDRPSLHRGIPKGQSTPAQLTGTPPSLHQVVAISDAADRDTHIFTREWASSAEHAQTLAAIEALAKPHIAKYLKDLSLTPAPPPSASTSPQASSSASTTPQASSSAPAQSRTPRLQPRVSYPSKTKGVLTPAKPPTFTTANEHLSGYNLTYGGLPTFIYTAEVPITTGGPIEVTIIAQHLPSGDFQLSLAQLADASHLDRAPWYRPIDVVDPDWSHRGNILFELRSQSTRQFALYQVVSAEAEQTFISGLIE
jgi:hypothetical protein